MIHSSVKAAASRRHRGTALVMVVIISVILTGLVMTIAWSAGVQSQVTGSSVHLDQANLAAEAMGQWAVWNFKKSNTWRYPPSTGTAATLPTFTFGTNTFDTTMTCIDAGATATLYWPFDTVNTNVSPYTTPDASGNGNTGIFYGGVAYTSSGRYNGALTFDGATGYVDAGNKPSTNIVGSVTMSAWVKLNTADQDQKVGGNQDGYSGGYKMSIYGLKVEFETRDASNNAWLNRSMSGGTILTMNIWYHVAGVYDSVANTITTYVNGVVDRGPYSVPINALSTTTGDFVMGKEPWISGGNTRFFNGSIDDVRVYNRALSANEIKTLANTSVQVTAKATLHNGGSTPPTSTVSFICSDPTPSAPIAPAITTGGNLQLKYATVSGDVQSTGSISGQGASAVTGHVTYGTSYSDSHNYIAITYNGKTAAATQNTSATAPTIPYASIQGQAISTSSGGSNQTYTFGYLANQINIIYVNGNVTDPVIDTSQSAGTLIINGTLTLTKNATWGSAGFPAYIICEKDVTQSGGTLNLTGALYVGGNWSHKDCAIYGDVCVTGNVTDNTVTGSTFVVGSIPWFDPRVSTAPTTLPLFYTDYQGLNP